jgi:allophanate hydrolase subunit 2
MGSRSTYIAGQIGGVQGRDLLKGDVLYRGESSCKPSLLTLPEHLRPTFSRNMALRAMPGPQDNYFDSGMEIFFSSQFSVTAAADRVGYRLEGPTIPFADGVPQSIISEANMPGMVQVPPDGQPIIVLGEQTASGYAKIATVITPDLDLVAQARPGDVIEFTRIDLAEAHSAYFQYRQRLEQIKAVLRHQVD